MFGGRDRWDRHAIDQALDGDTAEQDWRSQQPGLKRDSISAGADPATGSVHTVAGIAERWGCSIDQVYSLIRGGQLESFKVGPRLIRVRHDRLLAYEAEYGQPS
jgi:excisionase family DNA binding protein